MATTFPQNTSQPARPMRPVNDDIDLLKYFYMFLGNWYWFVLALIVSLGIAFFINRYSAKVYRVTAWLLIEDESGKGSGLGASMLGGGDLMAGFGMYPGWYNLQNQILIMKSQTLISKTLHSLDFNVSYFSDEILGPQEKLSEVPFVVMPDYSKPQPLGITFSVKINGDGTFGLTCEVTGDEPKLYNYLSEKVNPLSAEIHADGKFKYGDVIQGEGYSFVLVPRNNGETGSVDRKSVV